jgi:hypothetical protein
MVKIGTTHFSKFNNNSTNIECGNYLPPCSHTFVDDPSDCAKGGENCCYMYHGRIGSCNSFPSLDFVNSYKKVKNETVQCSGEMTKTHLLVLLIGIFLF